SQVSTVHGSEHTGVRTFNRGLCHLTHGAIAAGATAIFASGAFERRFRDVHALTPQIHRRPPPYQAAGRALLRPHPPPTFIGARPFSPHFRDSAAAAGDLESGMWIPARRARSRASATAVCNDSGRAPFRSWRGWDIPAPLEGAHVRSESLVAPSRRGTRPAPPGARPERPRRAAERGGPGHAASPADRPARRRARGPEPGTAGQPSGPRAPQTRPPVEVHLTALSLTIRRPQGTVPTVDPLPRGAPPMQLAARYLSTLLV